LLGELVPIPIYPVDAAYKKTVEGSVLGYWTLREFAVVTNCGVIIVLAKRVPELREVVEPVNSTPLTVLIKEAVEIYPSVPRPWRDDVRFACVWSGALFTVMIPLLDRMY
jgi:hypothetical protein